MPLNDNTIANNIKATSILELGLLLPLLSIFSIASVYYFELGYFVFFEIPSSFIQVELTKNTFLIFSSIAISFLVIFFLQPLLDSWTISIDGKVKWLYAVGAILFPFIILGLVGMLASTLFRFETIFLLLCFFIGVLLTFYKKNKSITNVIQENILLRYIADLTSPVLGLVLLICSAICIVMFSSGYLNAKFKKIPTSKDKRSELIKYYDDYKIYKAIERLNGYSVLIISKSSSDNDTILVK